MAQEADRILPGFPAEDVQSEFSRERKLAIGGVAAAFVVASALYISGYLERSGDYTVYPPQDDQPETIDTDYRVGSWNMHNETAVRISDLRAFARQEELDVLMLQEVNSGDAQQVAQKFPQWGITYVLADTKQELQRGGFGNVIMTRHQKPKDVTTRSFEGNSAIEAVSGITVGAAVDLWNGDMSLVRSRQGMQENRAAVAVTGQAYNGDDQINVRLITSHIARRQGLHEAQLRALIDFAGDNTKDNRPTVLCGDLNGDQKEIISSFGEAGFRVEATGHTSVTRRQTLDYCAYNGIHTLGLAATKVAYDYSTDHYPVVASWKLGTQDK